MDYKLQALVAPDKVSARLSKQAYQEAEPDQEDGDQVQLQESLEVLEHSIIMKTTPQI